MSIKITNRFWGRKRADRQGCLDHHVYGLSRRSFFVLCGLLLAFPSIQSVAADSEARPPLVIGIAPHTSARALFSSYQPLRMFLINHLQRDVRVVSAPNFEAFLHRALDGRYDIVITTGHQARLLQKDAGWQPLVTYQADFSLVLIKATNNPKIKRVEDLDGRRFLTLGPGSLTALWGKQYLEERGIAPVEVDFVSASDSLAERVVAGAADAGALSQTGVDQLASNLRQKIQVFEHGPSVLGRTYMLSPRLSDDYRLMRAALDAFAQADEGLSYFQRNQLGGYRDVLPSELEAMDRYAEELRQLMAVPPRSAPPTQYNPRSSTQGMPHVVH